MLASSTPIPKDCTDCGLRISPCDFAISRLRTPSIAAFVGGFASCARHGTERTPRELLGTNFEDRSWVRAAPGSIA
eukprot:9191949-Alexandrium_andersonii.AAC.1